MPDQTLSWRPGIVCLGGGVEAMPIIKQVDKTGYTPFVVDFNPDSPGHIWARDNKHKAQAWRANPYSPDAVLQTVDRIMKYSMRDYKVAGVLCTATDAPLTQARLAKKLKVHHTGVKQAEAAQNKLIQHRYLHESGLPVPPTKEIDINSRFDPGFQIVKPICGRGAAGVSLTNESNFRDCLISALVNSNPKSAGKVIAQRHLPGLQLSTESVIRNFEVIFTAVALRNYDQEHLLPAIIENGSDCPFVMSPKTAHRLNDLILRACIALDWNNCTVKCDIVLDQDVFYLIEMSPRLSGGFFCTDIIPRAYGFNMVGAAISLCVGKDIVRRKVSMGSIVYQRFLFPPSAWIGKTIKSISAPEGVTLYKGPGYVVKPVQAHRDRIAQVIAGSREECASLLGSIEVVLE